MSIGGMAAGARFWHCTRVSRRLFAVTSATDIAVDLSIMARNHVGSAMQWQNWRWASMEAAMSNSYWRTERLIVDAVDRRILQKPGIWDGVASIVGDPDLLVLATICTIGLLLSLAVTIAVPGFAETTEALQ